MKKPEIIINFRASRELVNKLKKEARLWERSLSSQIRFILENSFKTKK